MKQTVYTIYCFLILCFCACQADSSATGNNSGNPIADNSTKVSQNKAPTKAKIQTAENGTEYSVFSKGTKGRQPRLGDYMTMHIEWTTPGDSIIFSSFSRNYPLNFKLSETLFRGALNDGLSQMRPGDSAVFDVPAKILYPTILPSFLKKGDHLSYTVKLLDVEDAETREQRKGAASNAPTIKDIKSPKK